MPSRNVFVHGRGWNPSPTAEQLFTFSNNYICKGRPPGRPETIRRERRTLRRDDYLRFTDKLQFIVVLVNKNRHQP